MRSLTVGILGIFSILLLQYIDPVLLVNAQTPSQGQTVGTESRYVIPHYTSVKTFGCEMFGSRIHCDPTLSDFTSNKINGNFKTITPLSTSSLFVDGKYGKAVKMDAKYRESVEISNSQSIGSNQFAFSLFVRNSNVAEPYGQIVSHINFAHTAGWNVDMITDTTNQPFVQSVRFSVANSAGTVFSPPPVTIAQDRFVQISGTFDGSFVRFYVDGELSGEVPFNGKFDPNPGTPLRIGSASYSTSTSRWSGIIDELMIFNSTLTEQQVREIPTVLNDGKNIDRTFESEAILGYWPFEGNVLDASNHGRDGTTTTLLASMAFAPDGTLFFSAKNTGEIKIMRNDVILDEPFAILPDTYVNWEQGLLGLTLDSKFSENHYIYQYYTYKAANGEILNKIVRFTDVNDKGIEMKILLDQIPAVEGYHSGGALAFGSDDKLYATVGDATYHEFAMDPNILIGKVLRLNRDGTIPADNPNPASPIFTKGHRNMYGIAFDSNGTGIVTENGDTLYDEINVIRKAGNYGFPLLQPANVSPYLSDPSKSILPIRSYYLTVAPTQAIYYTGDKIPELKGKFLFGTFTGDIFALTIDKDSKRVLEEEKVLLHPILFTPVIGLAQSPNGDIYFGSYSIFKLESLDISTKTQDVYPVDVAATQGISVNNLVFDQDAKKLVLEVDTLPIQSTDSETPSSRSLTITINKNLIDNVRAVTDGSNNPVNYMVDPAGTASSSRDYYNVTIGVDKMVGKNYIVFSAVKVIPEFSLAQGFLLMSAAMLVVVITIMVISKNLNVNNSDNGLSSIKK